uniref:Uncharacterized protein n=1 Tax=Anguilla anguilla TaxID=7936 RepID=A0A0E9PZX1_ANGAN
MQVLYGVVALFSTTWLD